MYSLNRSSAQNGSSQARRSPTTGFPWPTSTNRAMAESRASATVVARTGNPSASSAA